MRLVKLKSTKELIKLGYDIKHISDDGEFILFGKDGMELGMWTDIQYEPHEVVYNNTIHINTVQIFPDAFVDVDKPTPKAKGE